MLLRLEVNWWGFLHSHISYTHTHTHTHTHTQRFGAHAHTQNVMQTCVSYFCVCIRTYLCVRACMCSVCVYVLAVLFLYVYVTRSQHKISLATNSYVSLCTTTYIIIVHVCMYGFAMESLFEVHDLMYVCTILCCTMTMSSCCVCTPSLRLPLSRVCAVI